jgi:hypothetical protein
MAGIVVASTSMVDRNMAFIGTLLLDVIEQDNRSRALGRQARDRIAFARFPGDLNRSRWTRESLAYIGWLKRPATDSTKEG